MQSASTRYNTPPWGMAPPTVENQALGPDRSLSERLVTERMLTALQGQPPVPQVPLFRPRFGYRTEAYGINDIMNVDYLFNPPNVGTWYSGGPGETNSSSTYSNYSATMGNL